MDLKNANLSKIVSCIQYSFYRLFNKTFSGNFSVSQYFFLMKHKYHRNNREKIQTVCKNHSWITKALNQIKRIIHLS